MRAFLPTFMTSDHWSAPPIIAAFTFTKHFTAWDDQGFGRESSRLCTAAFRSGRSFPMTLQTKMCLR